MKFILQRVLKAKVEVEEKTIAEINQGILALVGLGKDSKKENFSEIISKIINLRIFPSIDGRFNHSLLDTVGEIILVPQFTLYADTSKGRRPEFFDAMPPKEAKNAFETLIREFKEALPNKVQAGEFGANMNVTLTNWGPVTITLEF